MTTTKPFTWSEELVITIGTICFFALVNAQSIALISSMIIVGTFVRIFWTDWTFANQQEKLFAFCDSLAEVVLAGINRFIMIIGLSFLLNIIVKANLSQLQLLKFAAFVWVLVTAFQILNEIRLAQKTGV